MRRNVLATLTLGSATTLAFSVAPVQASDHLDAPNVEQDGQSDLNDLYAFPNGENTVLIQTVNPFAGQSEPDFFGVDRPDSPTTFGTDVEYNFRIDNNGDTEPDVTYTTTFSDGPAGDTQSLTTTRTAGGSSTTVATGNTGTELSTTGGGRAQAGLFDDPFFFDESGFFETLSGEDGPDPGTEVGFTGRDSFAGANVSAIVLEVPSSELGADVVRIDATTAEDGSRVDRVGRPAINTALIPEGMKTDFNLAEPMPSATNEFRDEVIASIESLGTDSETAETLADTLLPDLLDYDANSDGEFANFNGRQLDDDVIDTVLTLVTDGAITTDLVDSNDVDFPGVFPYLADPQDIGGDGDIDGDGTAIPTPGAATAGLAMLGLMLYRRPKKRGQV